MNHKYNFSVIFDMDGVLVNNSKFHFRSWAVIAKKLGFHLTDKFYREKLNGRKAVETVNSFTTKKLSLSEIYRLAEQKEQLYRKIYKPYIKPVNGLEKFLKLLKRNGIKIGMATSAPKGNIDFVFKYTQTRKYFKTIVGAAQIKRGKPHPDVYLKAARLIKASPKNCVVFEDALNGIEAAQRAGMKVIALETTNKAKVVSHADLVIKDFSKLTLEKINSLFQ